MCEEKREFIRRHVRSFMSVVRLPGGESIGQLVDITSNGLLVISPEQIEIGIESNMCIELSTPLEGKLKIGFRTRSVWCEADLNPEYFAVGYTITAIEPEALRLVELLIEKYALRVLPEDQGESAGDELLQN